ncbi:MAG: DUF4926 domain-containing protein [Limisphaerales bacterium]
MKLPNADKAFVDTCYRNGVQKTPVKLFDVVALLEDKPGEGLSAGHVGTVVEVFAPDVFEVEFLDSSGKVTALAELKCDELLLLKHETAVAA